VKRASFVRIGASLRRLSLGVLRLFGVGSSLTRKRRYCLIDGRPVRSVHNERGELEIQEFNPLSGRFERNMALLTKVFWGGIEVEYVSKKTFHEAVERLRRP
jgi:hypothetical protein